MFSTVVWIALSIPFVIFLGGLYIWKTRKLETKPHLAARMDETEAQILDEQMHNKGEDDNGREN